jgi:hypothetical protein
MREFIAPWIVKAHNIGCVVDGKLRCYVGAWKYYWDPKHQQEVGWIGVKHNFKPIQIYNQ